MQHEDENVMETLENYRARREALAAAAAERVVSTASFNAKCPHDEDAPTWRGQTSAGRCSRCCSPGRRPDLRGVDPGGNPAVRLEALTSGPPVYDKGADEDKRAEQRRAWVDRAVAKWLPLISPGLVDVENSTDGTLRRLRTNDRWASWIVTTGGLANGYVPCAECGGRKYVDQYPTQGRNFGNGLARRPPKDMILTAPDVDMDAILDYINENPRAGSIDEQVREVVGVQVSAMVAAKPMLECPSCAKKWKPGASEYESSGGTMICDRCLGNDGKHTELQVLLDDPAPRFDMRIAVRDGQAAYHKLQGETAAQLDDRFPGDGKSIAQRPLVADMGEYRRRWRDMVILEFAVKGYSIRAIHAGFAEGSKRTRTPSLRRIQQLLSGREAFVPLGPPPPWLVDAIDKSFGTEQQRAELPLPFRVFLALNFAVGLDPQAVYAADRDEHSAAA